MKQDTVVKVVRVVAGLAGIGASIASSWIAQKELDAKISEGVAKALANKE